MIGKIMSEASHSIIGTLSAKLSDMETRTTHNEFSSLLAPGEDRPRPMSGDGTEDTRNEQFLEQYITTDSKSAPTAIGPDIPKTIAFTASVDGSRGDAELPSDTSSSTSVSEMDRFISHLLPTATETANANVHKNAPLAARPSTVGQILSGISTDEPATSNRSYPNGKGPRTTELPMVDNGVDKPKRELGNVSKVTSIPLIFVDGPTTNEVTTPASDLDQKLAMGAKVQNAPVVADKNLSTFSDEPVSEGLKITPAENKQSVESKSPAAFRPDIESTQKIDGKPQDKSAAIDLPIQSLSTKMPTDIPSRDSRAKTQITKTILSGAEPLLASSTLQAAGSGPKIQDLLDLRSDSKTRVAASSSRQFAEIETRETVIAAEKPIKIETKASIVEMENLPTAAPLDANVETVMPAHPTTVPGGQSSMQKTVNFDWNAPQFAERFASEIGDLRINGDLKKFEINPRNMGRLEISLLAQGPNEIIQIEAENQAARDVIAQHSQAIQEMLKAQGRSDLLLRVDLKENMLSAGPNDNMNFEQQDSANAQQERSARSPSHRSAMASGSEVEPQNSDDNGRYA